MALTRGPLFSFDASGAIANAIVYSKWKGRPYVRQLVTPANPDTLSQRSVRANVRFVSQQYAGLSTTDKAAWVTAGATDSITGLDAWARDTQFRKNNNNGVRSNPTNPAGTAPGAPTAPTATGGKGQVTISWVNSLTGTPYATYIDRGTTGFTPSPSTTELLVPASTTTTVVRNLSPGTYFFKLRHANDGGTMGSTSTEVSATVT